MKRVGILLPLLTSILAISVIFGLGRDARANPESGAIPITSASPWQEVTGTIQSGSVISYSFSGSIGQIVSIDAFMPVTLTMKGQINLVEGATDSSIDDEIFGLSTTYFNQSGKFNEVWITSELPATDEYFIEIAPSSVYTADFSLRFNVLDPGSLIEVDDDLVECPSAHTGIVRSAVRAVNAYGRVSICKGNYREIGRAIIGKPQVFLYGAGSDVTKVLFEADGMFQIGYDPAVNVPNVYIRDLTLDSTTFSPVIYLDQGSYSFGITDCRIGDGGSYTNGIQTTSVGPPHQDLEVSYCDFEINQTKVSQLSPIQVRSDYAEIWGNNFITDTDHYVRNGILLYGDNANIHDNVFGHDVEDTISFNFDVVVNVVGDRLTFEDNEVLSYKTGLRLSPTGVINERLEAATIRNNIFGANVQALGSSSFGIYASRVISADISGNYFRGRPQVTYGIYLDRTGGRVINNRLDLSTAYFNHGIYVTQLAGPPSDTNPSHPLSIVNNTIRYPGTNTGGSGVTVDLADSITTTVPITIVNNIFANLGEGPPIGNCGIDSDVPLQYTDYNLTDDLHPYCGSVLAGANDFQADVVFLDDELHLSNVSQAIDAGTPLEAPLTDFEGEVRPLNLGFDIGADEVDVPADLSVIKTGPGCAYRPTQIQYDIVARNSGPGAAVGVVITESINIISGLDSISISKGSCSGSWPVQCEIDLMMPGETVTATIMMNPAVAGNYRNSVSISSEQVDLTLEDAQNSILTAIYDQVATAHDLQAIALEVTQGIQTMDNEVDLIENKETYVRFYVRAVGGPIFGLDAELRGSRDGQPLPGSPLPPVFDCLSRDAGDPDRTDLMDSFLFKLPDEWLHGDVTLEAEVISVNPATETNLANNSISEPMQFPFYTPPICIKTYPVLTCRTRNSDGECTSEIYPNPRRLSSLNPEIVDRALSLLPTPEIWVYGKEHVVNEDVFWDDDPYEFESGDDDTEGLMFSLLGLRTWSSDPIECRAAGAQTHYLGMIRQDTINRAFSGYGWMVGNVLAITVFTDSKEDGPRTPLPRTGTTLAHEIGHNQGLWHIDQDISTCGGTDPAAGIGSYPYNNCWLDDEPPDSSTAHFGFDTFPSTPVPISPRDAADLMTYADNRWTSDVTWEKIWLEIFLGQFGDRIADQATIPSRLSATEIIDTPEVLYVTGIVFSDTAQINEVLKVPTETIPPEKLAELSATGTSTYTLDLLDESGSLLYSHPISLTLGLSVNKADTFFQYVLPYITDTQSVRLSVQATALVTVTSSDHEPQITLDSPLGGETVTDTLTISWSASDLDGDDLSFMVQYSADLGQSWEVLKINSYSDSFEADLSFEPGSDGQSLIRVLANDGFHTTIVESAPFSVAFHGPEAAIKDPLNGQTFTVGDQITASGWALDPEDGFLPGSSLSWSIDEYGELGSGKELDLPLLAEGTYELRLEATDSDGLVDQTSVTFIIAAPQKSTIFLPLVTKS